MPNASSRIQAWKSNMKPVWSKSETYPELISLFRRKRHLILEGIRCKLQTSYTRGYANLRQTGFGHHTRRNLSLLCQAWVLWVCRREQELPFRSAAVFLQFWSHFSVLCPSFTPVRPPHTAGYNMALGNGDSTNSCSRLKLEKYPKKGIASLAGERGRLTQPPAAAEAILDRGTTERKGSPQEPVPSE